MRQSTDSAESLYGRTGMELRPLSSNRFALTREVPEWISEYMRGLCVDRLGDAFKESALHWILLYHRKPITHYLGAISYQQYFNNGASPPESKSKRAIHK